MFQVGNKVYWESQAGGFTKRKEGTVLAIIPAGQLASVTAREINEQAGYIYSGFDNIVGGHSRNHESYLVLVPNKTKAGGKLYWPRVSALR